MKIAIIGGGYTGLAAAYYLSKNKDVEISIFEKDKTLGGLASGIKDKNWKWSLDKYYHHIFTTDKEILELLKEINCPLTYIRPKTSIYYTNKIFPFDSALHLLQFPHLSLISRFRTGLAILILKLIINWKPLEKITAKKFVLTISGNESWKVIWKPLFQAKFDEFADKVPASWLWSRIKKRGNVFGYPNGGFDSITNALVKTLKTNRVKIAYKTEVKAISKTNSFTIKTNRGTYHGYDKVIYTSSAKSLTKIVKLPLPYKQKLLNLKSRGTVNLILSLKNQFLTDGTYWLNVNDKNFPFIGVIEQTNFINKNKYNNNKIIHLVNYLSPSHPYFKTTNNKLIKKFLPYLQKINPDFKRNWIIKSWICKSTFAQPIVSLKYSNIVPPNNTPIDGLFLANMQQVYPWDRQTNYAIAMGKKVSELISKAS